MATIKQVYSSENELTITTASLADGSAADSTAYDNSTTLYLDGQFEITLVGTVTTSIDNVDVYYLGSNDNTDFPTTEAANMQFVGSVEANEATSVTKLMRINGLHKYFKIRLANESGGALSSTEADCYIKFVGVNLSNA